MARGHGAVPGGTLVQASGGEVPSGQTALAGSRLPDVHAGLDRVNSGEVVVVARVDDVARGGAVAPGAGGVMARPDEPHATRPTRPTSPTAATAAERARRCRRGAAGW